MTMPGCTAESAYAALLRFAVPGTSKPVTPSRTDKMRLQGSSGGILIAMAVMAVVGVVLAHLEVLAYQGGGSSTWKSACRRPIGRASSKPSSGS
jgi:hypothetical protein